MTSALTHTIEFLLGLPKDFLHQQGEWSLQFNPAWPGQAFIGAPVWNILLSILAILLVMYVYTHDGRSRPLRITLGTIRALLFALVLVLLNRPILTLGQSRTEPSVLAVMIDDSSSMRVPDVGSKSDPQPRLSAVQSLFASGHGELLRTLAKKHNIQLYRFDRTAMPMAEVLPPPGETKDSGEDRSGDVGHRAI